ncbi:hypothetical protein EVAR_62325_1 [Eumeta japonica]|uniref:Uncharacterized protein n=1 Tax=Eumeta variegata TaxID=151549 RepID=A0A4C1Z8S7_EUMVA|nr:hypothetical protein EVAR_62325_1 [Eumeta japonica]
MENVMLEGGMRHQNFHCLDETQQQKLLLHMYCYTPPPTQIVRDDKHKLSLLRWPTANPALLTTVVSTAQIASRTLVVSVYKSIFTVPDVARGTQKGRGAQTNLSERGAHLGTLRNIGGFGVMRFSRVAVLPTHPSSETLWRAAGR